MGPGSCQNNFTEPGAKSQWFRLLQHFFLFIFGLFFLFCYTLQPSEEIGEYINCTLASLRDAIAWSIFADTVG